MKQIVMTYPDGLEEAVRLTPEELAFQLRLMAGLKMFELGKISSGKAAELAGIPRTEFFEACGRYHVSIFNYSAEELESEIESDLIAIRGTAS